MPTTTTTYPAQLAYVPQRAGTLYDVLELILDRGMVIDVFIRVSLVGIEILKIDARVVVASVDTYLRFAEACNRLDLESDAHSRTVPELFGMGEGEGGGSVRKKAAKKAVTSAGRKAKDALTSGSDDDDSEEREESGSGSRRRTASRSGTTTRRKVSR